VQERGSFNELVPLRHEPIVSGDNDRYPLDLDL
jgi:hypothetical protein